MRFWKQWLSLSEPGYRDLKRSVFGACVKKLSVILTYGMLVLLMREILRALETGGLNTGRVWVLFLAGLGCAALTLGAVVLSYRTNFIPTYRESRRLRYTVAEKMRRLSMSFFDAHDISELAGHMLGDCAVSESAFSDAATDLTSDLIVTPIFFLLLACIDWRLALCVFASVPIAVCVALLGLRRQRTLTRRQTAKKLAASEKVREYLEGIRVIKTNGLSGERFQSMADALNDLKNASIELEVTAGVFVAGADLLLQIGIGVLIFAASVYLAGGTVALLTVLLYFSVVLRIYEPIAGDIGQLSASLYFRESLQRLNELLHAPEMGGTDVPDTDDLTLSLRNVTFGYQPARPVLRELSVDLLPGQFTAIVGPSGSGKSTLVKLITRLYDPQSGEISLGRKRLSDLDPEALQQCFAVVSQDTVLFEDTVEQNLRMGNGSASEADVLQAAAAAQCLPFIERMPDGMQTVLAENGRSLSGGERARLSIARALLKRAPLLLLDEPTAELDPENEALVQQALSNLLAENATVIMVAHNLRTIVNADQILVLQDGRLVQQGTHETLIAADGLYKTLFDRQMRNLKWQL